MEPQSSRMDFHYLILGIDPGINGAMALYDPEKDELIRVHSMPKDKEGKIDTFALALVFDSFASNVSYAVLEDVHSMPGQGVVSMFNFGQSVGLIKGILASHNVPVYLVKPAVWKGSLGLGRDKEDSRTMAIKMFGENYFPRKKDEGKAEAALLAHFGKRFWG